MPSAACLSILIPVYNYDIAALLKVLNNQCNALKKEPHIEIIVLDDGSQQKYNNQTVAAAIDRVRYIESAENKGRAATRNQLIKEATGKYLLFLDADMQPDKDDFIQQYLQQAEKHADVVCGGISYQQNKDYSDDYAFYLYKSKRTEALPASQRNQSPLRYLFTSNILLRAECVEQIPFNTRFKDYGYEDIEWGIRLAEKYPLIHIDNSASHMGLVSRQQVFERMRASSRNFALLLSLHPDFFSKSSAARLAACLQYLPDFLLTFTDGLCKGLFTYLENNRLLFYVFQLDKVIRLSQELKNRRL
ncbi:MAG: glycosyltransferase family 2 protein [gamma proteobacterium symbiont of Bathyaustriella thionipta]|nr:glycosyltransferase family 2 protein [gamma proteobacterium symbiont of Bathyaustriella thionipta]